MATSQLRMSSSCARVSARRSACVVRCTAAPSPAPSQPAPAIPNSRTLSKLHLLPSLSRLAEIQSWTTKYEMVAGRSAMLGTLTAIAVETLTEESLLGEGLPQEVFAALAFGTVLIAGLTAALTSQAANPTTPPALLEPVITSLTAVKGSASSVTYTGGSVDTVVDQLVQSTFTSERIRQLTDFADADL